MKKCLAIDCEAEATPGYAFCGKHWRMIPAEVKKEIYRSRGEYQKALSRAVIYAALYERRMSRKTAQHRLARLNEAG